MPPMTPHFNTKADLMAALAQAQPGEARAALLYEHHNRALALNTGSNVTLFDDTSVKDRPKLHGDIRDTRLLLVHRRNVHTGAPDGVGALGGMAERDFESIEAFDARPDAEKAELARQKDDIAREGGRWVRLDDRPDLIAVNNVRREMTEELADLGLDPQALGLTLDGMEPIGFRGLRDDNYILNIWNPAEKRAEEVFAVTPVCHLQRLPVDIFDRVADAAAQMPASHEMLGLRSVALTDALGRYGKPGGPHRSNDGRDLRTDYRYPHEWFAAWAVAAHILAPTHLYNTRQALADLAGEVQRGLDYKLDFLDTASRLGVAAEGIEAGFGTGPGTLQGMQDAADRAFTAKPDRMPKINPS